MYLAHVRLVLVAVHEQGSRSPTSEDGRGVVNKLDEAIEREVRPWLDLVDSLRTQGIQDELSLPQVCVVQVCMRECLHLNIQCSTTLLYD